MSKIQSFIKRIEAVDNESLGSSKNLYRIDNIDGQIRSWNLNLYLENMKKIAPKILLLGEAPGYNGCGLTGIPFTSEKIIATTPFFSRQNYRFINKADMLQNQHFNT